MSGHTSVLARYASFYNDAKEVLGLFRNQYSVLPALTPNLAGKAYNMRYKVYCDELGFEPPNGVEAEQDRFDAQATQLVLQYKPLDVTIGCARFVPARQGDVTIALPMEETCAGQLNQDVIKRIQDSGSDYAELSRLAVDRDFRKAKDGAGKVGKGGKVGRSCASLMLFIGIQTYAKIANIDYLFAIVERKLINSFHKLNIPVESLGQPVEHHGTRYPIVIDIRKSLRTFPPLLIKPLCKSVEAEMLKLIEVHTAQQLHAGNIATLLPAFAGSPIPIAPAAMAGAAAPAGASFSTFLAPETRQ